MFAVRVEDEYVGLMGRYVAEGQSIVPGAPLLDIITPEGIVKTIVAEAWGIVAHVEGGRIFAYANGNNQERAEDDDEDDDEDGESGQGRSSSGGIGAVFSKGDVICHIVAREQHGTRKSGLHPRPAPSVRIRRAAGTSPC